MDIPRGSWDRDEGELLKGLLKALKRRGRDLLTICPRCGSPTIDQLNPLGGWLTPPIYVCKKCGYTGPILLEVDKVSDAEVGEQEGENP